MANNADYPHKRINNPAKRVQNYQEVVDQILNQTAENPAFYGMEIELDIARRTMRIPTPYGNVMYYPSSLRWQWRVEIHIGGPDEFIPWLAHFYNTGVSNRRPQKTSHPSGKWDK